MRRNGGAPAAPPFRRSRFGSAGKRGAARPALPVFFSGRRRRALPCSAGAAAL